MFSFFYLGYEKKNDGKPRYRPPPAPLLWLRVSSSGPEILGLGDGNSPQKVPCLQEDIRIIHTNPLPAPSDGGLGLRVKARQKLRQKGAGLHGRAASHRRAPAISLLPFSASAPASCRHVALEAQPGPAKKLAPPQRDNIHHWAPLAGLNAYRLPLVCSQLLLLSLGSCRWALFTLLSFGGCRWVPFALRHGPLLTATPANPTTSCHRHRRWRGAA